jgi:hypothetical protein
MNNYLIEISKDEAELIFRSGNRQVFGIDNESEAVLYTIEDFESFDRYALEHTKECIEYNEKYESNTRGECICYEL